MLKKLVNEAKFSLTLTTTGPVLIRSGVATAGTGRNPDMMPVLTYRNEQRQVYFPGSSLKGVFRSHLEKIGRTLNEDAICNPFDRQSFCGERLHKKGATQAYQRSCPACRLFGSTAYTGRIHIGDAYLTNPRAANPVELRDGVGIDRFTGGAVSGALFSLEAVSPEVDFSTEIYLRNFECWQLGMILLVVQDLADGLIRIGSGTSRGLGNIVGQVDSLTIHHLGLPQKDETEVWGLGKFLANETANYGTQSDDLLSLAQSPETEQRGIRLVSQFAGEALTELQREASAAFVRYLQNREALQ